MIGRLFEEWESARGFLVNGRICGSWSFPSTEEFSDAEIEVAQLGETSIDLELSFDIFDEHGEKREYFVSPEQIMAGKLEEGVLTVHYDDGMPLRIEPLFVRPVIQREEAAA